MSHYSSIKYREGREALTLADKRGAYLKRALVQGGGGGGEMFNSMIYGM